MRVATMESPPLCELIADLLQQLCDGKLCDIENERGSGVDEMVCCNI